LQDEVHTREKDLPPVLLVEDAGFGVVVGHKLLLGRARGVDGLNRVASDQ
jgi:hypothetical protein